MLISVSTHLFAAGKEETLNNLGDVKGGESKKAHAIIDKKCTKCHSSDKIDIALKEHKDMLAIQKKMEQKGVRLNSKERDVLGIFWKESAPLK